MEPARKTRFLVWIIAILAVFNISLLGTIFILPHYNNHRDADRVGRDNHQGEPRHYLTRMLNLNEKQEVVFDSSRRGFFREADTVFKKLQTYKCQMFTELSSQNPDSVKLNEIAAQIGFLHTQLKQSTIRHFLMLRKECTPEQQKILSKVFGRMLNNEGHFQGGGSHFDGERKTSPQQELLY
jgi:hypothetical protein